MFHYIPKPEQKAPKDLYTTITIRTGQGRTRQDRTGQDRSAVIVRYFFALVNIRPLLIFVNQLAMLKIPNNNFDELFFCFKIRLIFRQQIAQKLSESQPYSQNEKQVLFLRHKALKFYAFGTKGIY